MPGDESLAQNFDNTVFVVTSYALVREVFQNHQTYSSQFVEVMMRGAEPHPEADALFKNGIKQGSLLLNLDEPVHRFYRSLVATAFTPKQAAAMLPKMEEIIHALIDNIIARGSCDFVEEIAVPYPIYVIADLLGYDRAIYPRLRHWSTRFCFASASARARPKICRRCATSWTSRRSTRRRSPSIGSGRARI